MMGMEKCTAAAQLAVDWRGWGDEKQRSMIEQTVQATIDTRALYPDASLADLYDETTMPPELKKAHQNNDRAVIMAYGFKVGEITESKYVAELMKRYQALTGK